MLCVGAAGNGKTSTLAAMIDHMNHNIARHIVTIEDPIEYIHIDDKCSISQREIGFDTQSFASALRAALRQDPDVIHVGEIRDAETMEIALKAAETGHLVLSTLHTPDVARTMNRIISLERRRLGRLARASGRRAARHRRAAAAAARRRPGHGARRRGAWSRPARCARPSSARWAIPPLKELMEAVRRCTGCRPSRCTSRSSCERAS